MREPRRIAGARAPLFERLAEVEGTAADGAPPPRVLDRAALLASIVAAVAQLCNTRRTRPAAEPGGPGWVLDYGVPDFGGLSAASAPDRERYARELGAAIAAFEPRLRGAQVTLEPVPGDPLRLRGRLGGEVQLGGIREVVSFPLLLQTASGEVRLDDAPAAEDDSEAAG